MELLMSIPVISPIFRTILRILSFILFLLTVVSAYGGRVNPDWLTLPSVLVLALPYFVIASAIVILAWLLSGRWITAAAGVLALAAAWGPISTAMPMHFPKKPTPGAKTFTLLTYNILHCDDQQTDNQGPGNPSLEYVINSGADIVCLQELDDFSDEEIHHFTPSLRDSLFSTYPYRAGTTFNDLKVLSKYPVRQLRTEDYLGPEGAPICFAFFKVDIDDRPLTLFVMHVNGYELSPEERDVLRDVASVKGAKEGVDEMKGSIRSKLKLNFQRRKNNASGLRKAIDKVSGPLIVCGDFNDVPESYAYRLVRGDDMRDAYAETSFGPMVTYNRHAFWFHIDQIFYRGPLEALSVKKGTLKSSDHFPLIATFEFTDGTSR